MRIALGILQQRTDSVLKTCRVATQEVTRFILAKGLQPVVTGIDGRAYEADQWIDSKTFRSPRGHPNLLIADNQMMSYDAHSITTRRVWERSARGKATTPLVAEK